jgi:hypothetical protein
MDFTHAVQSSPTLRSNDGRNKRLGNVDENQYDPDPIRSEKQNVRVLDQLQGPAKDCERYCQVDGRRERRTRPESELFPSLP